MNLCEQYLEQVERLHGEDCAKFSTCKPAERGYVIGIWPDPTEPHTQEDLETMVAELSRRKPGDTAPSQAVVTLAGHLGREETT